MLITMNTQIKKAVKGMAFKKEFTIGDLVQVVVLLVGVIGAYFSLSARMTLLEQEVAFQKTLMNSRVTSLESVVGKQVSELDKKLEKFDRKIEQYEQLLREAYKQRGK